MMDFAAARRNMVEGQIRTNRVTDPGVIEAMLDIERERFVPPGWQPLAYSDRAIPLGEVASDPAHRSRVMLPPMALARLIQAARIQPGDKALHIGCNTGYATALLARHAAKVIALEEDDGFARIAAAHFSEEAFAHATLVRGRLAAGWAAEGPYDVILIEGGVERLPDQLAPQLAEDGRLVVIVNKAGTSRGEIVRRAGERLSGFPLFDAVAPVMAGFALPAEFVF
jgi:protein-L-isoaspartate(D-aspartate) O-methyltransferase